MSFLIPIGAAGAIFMAWLTPFGVGIYVDSLYYLSSAENLAAGIGIGRVTGLGTFKPMTHYPPFYSIVLTFFHLFRAPELNTARAISILAFGLVIILAGLIVYQRTRSRFFSLFSAILILGSNPILRNFSWAMTEPLFIFLMLSSLLCFGAYLHHPTRRWLILAGIFTSLSMLTRYAGFFLAGTFALAIILNRRTMWRTRKVALLIFLGITVLPSLLWLLRNWLVSDSLTNRVIAWHPISAENISFLIKAANSWGFLPQRLFVGNNTLVIAVIFIFLALASLLWLLRLLPRPDRSPRMEFVILLAGWSYVVLLITSLFFLDATTRMENRILLPLYVLLLLLIMIGSAFLWKRKTILARQAVIMICLWMAYFSFTRVDGAIADLRSDGQGYASLQWKKSPTAAYIRQQDAALIYTNDVTAIYFLAGKDSVGIPNANASEADFIQMRDNLRKPNSYLVIFGKLTGEFAPLDELTSGLSTAGSFMDGNIYQHR